MLYPRSSFLFRVIFVLFLFVEELLYLFFLSVLFCCSFGRRVSLFYYGLIIVIHHHWYRYYYRHCLFIILFQQTHGYIYFFSLIICYLLSLYTCSATCCWLRYDLKVKLWSDLFIRAQTSRVLLPHFRNYFFPLLCHWLFYCLCSLLHAFSFSLLLSHSLFFCLGFSLIFFFPISLYLSCFASFSLSHFFFFHSFFLSLFTSPTRTFSFPLILFLCYLQFLLLSPIHSLLFGQWFYLFHSFFLTFSLPLCLLPLLLSSFL